MAIAFDAAAGSAAWNPGTSLTTSHTCTGANLFLAVGTATYNSGGGVVTASGVTYNGVAMTEANAITAALESSGQEASIWYLDAPATGAHNVVTTWSASVTHAVQHASSYTGKTTTGIDANNSAQNTSASTSSPTCNVNVVHSDCWLVGFAYSRDASQPTAGTATTVRSGDTVGHSIGDSNGVVSTGNQTLAFTAGSATWPGVCSLSFSAANAGGGGGDTLMAQICL